MPVDRDLTNKKVIHFKCVIKWKDKKNNLKKYVYDELGEKLVFNIRLPILSSDIYHYKLNR